MVWTEAIPLIFLICALWFFVRGILAFISWLFEGRKKIALALLCKNSSLGSLSLSVIPFLAYFFAEESKTIFVITGTLFLITAVFYYAQYRLVVKVAANDRDNTKPS